jgi:hypothetical protein
MPLRQHHGKTSRVLPPDWETRHHPDCSGDCLDHPDDESYEVCPVWVYDNHDEWHGERPPIKIEADGTFFDLYGQVCRVLVDTPDSTPEGHPPLVNLGVIEALSPPGWDGFTKLNGFLYPTTDTMILGVDHVRGLLADLRTFRETGYVPQRQHTERGFGFNRFLDAIEQLCSFQDSSLATEAATWLGVDENAAGESVSNRMHLSPDMVDALIPLFESFVEDHA